MEDFKHCEEHKEYGAGITRADFENDLASDTMFFDWDNACDIEASDYGYIYCEECDKLIQVE